MKKIIAFLFFILSVYVVCAQHLYPEWIKTIPVDYNSYSNFHFNRFTTFGDQIYIIGSKIWEYNANGINVSSSKILQVNGELPNIILDNKNNHFLWGRIADMYYNDSLIYKDQENSVFMLDSGWNFKWAFPYPARYDMLPKVFLNNNKLYFMVKERIGNGLYSYHLNEIYDIDKGYLKSLFDINQYETNVYDFFIDSNQNITLALSFTGEYNFGDSTLISQNKNDLYLLQLSKDLHLNWVVKFRTKKIASVKIDSEGIFLNLTSDNPLVFDSNHTLYFPGQYLMIQLDANLSYKWHHTSNVNFGNYSSDKLGNKLFQTQNNYYGIFIDGMAIKYRKNDVACILLMDKKGKLRYAGYLSKALDFNNNQILIIIVQSTLIDGILYCYLLGSPAIKILGNYYFDNSIRWNKDSVLWLGQIDINLLIKIGFYGNIKTKNVSCDQISDGEIEINAADSMQVYEYSIDSGNTFSQMKIFPNLAKGTYYVAIKDTSNDIYIIPTELGGPVNLRDTIFDGNRLSYYGNTKIIHGPPGAISYHWSNGSTTDSMIITDSMLKKNHKYYLTVEDAKGCISTDTFIVLWYFYEGIEEKEAKPLILYPNPASQWINVEDLTIKETGTKLFVFDIRGKLILEKTIRDNLITLDVSGFSRGAYFVKMINGKHSYWGKFIKE